MRNILLVYNQMHTGGIETFIIRFANYYKNKGCKLKILLTWGGGELIDELNKIADVKTLRLKKLYVSPFINRKSIEKDPFYQGIDEVFSMYGGGSWIGLQIADIFNVPFKVGIYHPFDYSYYASAWERKLFDMIPDQCKIFMNNECLINHEKIFNRKINGLVWPVPVVVVDKKKQQEYMQIQPDKHKVVSVGRFDPYKPYNLTMIETIRQLKGKGINLTYDMYGFGVMEDEMRELIKKKGVTENVFIRGILKYADFQKVVRNYYIFIGCGTAAIEAAYAGIPTILAIESKDESRSNGIFTDDREYNLGEAADHLKISRTIDLMLDILQLPEQEYQQLGKRHTEVAIERYEVSAIFDKYALLPRIRVELTPEINRVILKSVVSFKLHQIVHDIKLPVKKLMGRKSGKVPV